MAPKKSAPIDKKLIESAVQESLAKKISNEEFQRAHDLMQRAEGMATMYIKNGLFGALGFPGSGGMGWPNNPYSEQLSDPTTIFKNLRWFLLSNYRQVLSEAYVELPLIQTLVDTPVDDALRGGVVWKSEQLDEPDIKKLQLCMDRNDDIAIAGYGAKWTRLFGGGGIMVITDQDPEEELDVDAINEDSLFKFRAVDMWELTWNTQNAGGYDPQIQETDFDYYNYYGEQVHHSRVMKLKGLTAPSFIRPRLRGWGFSIIESLVRSLNQYLKATDLTFEVLDEFKVDVYRVKNLVNTLLDPAGEQQIRQRFNESNYIKNYQNAIVMDNEDEYEQKQISFAGLAEVMQQIRMQIAADMRFPMVKLFGTPATGLSADDESSIEVYNTMVEGVRAKLKYDLLRMGELRCQYLFGFIPDDLEIEFKPLRQLSAVDEQTVKTSVFARAIQAKSAGELTTLEFRDICNKGEVFPIRLDTTEGELNPEDPEIAEMVIEGKSGAQKLASAEQDSEDSEIAADTRVTKPKKANSLEFDVASYEADGGDNSYDVRRNPFFENPLQIDIQKWKTAKELSQKAFGHENFGFITWKYKKLGGKFK